MIADASFISPAQRAAAAAAAAAAHADLVQLRCTAPAEVTAQRLAARTGGISDADAAIARQMAAVEAPWPEAVTIDTGQLSPGTAPAVPGEPPDAVVQQAMEAIRPNRPEHVWRPGPARAAPRLNTSAKPGGVPHPAAGVVGVDQEGDHAGKVRGERRPLIAASGGLIATALARPGTGVSPYLRRTTASEARASGGP